MWVGYDHVLMADGVALESLHPGTVALAKLPRRALADLRATVPDAALALLGCQPAARRVLKPHEARVLIAMLHQGDAALRIDFYWGLQLKDEATEKFSSKIFRFRRFFVRKIFLQPSPQPRPMCHAALRAGWVLLVSGLRAKGGVDTARAYHGGHLHKSWPKSREDRRSPAPADGPVREG